MDGDARPAGGWGGGCYLAMWDQPAVSAVALCKPMKGGGMFLTWAHHTYAGIRMLVQYTDMLCTMISPVFDSSVGHGGIGYVCERCCAV